MGLLAFTGVAGIFMLHPTVFLTSGLHVKYYRCAFTISKQFFFSTLFEEKIRLNYG